MQKLLGVGVISVKYTINLLQIPSCTRFTRYRVDSDLLSTPINLPITDPLLFDGSLSFSLPTDKMTEYSVTLTDENGIDLVFENIPISEFFTSNNY